jgi:hypothetical protein
LTRFQEGFAFLGFDIESRFVRMRAKSVENFKTKVREMTPRSHNLDAETIERLNRVIRGTANYFAMPWSHCGDVCRSLDRWIRMRLRCMKFKRKSRADNGRVSFEALRVHEPAFVKPFTNPLCKRIVSVPLEGAISTGPPGAGNPHAGKYEELTSSR